MVSISESTAEELENIAVNNDIELDKVREKFKDRYENLQERSDWSDEKVEQFALRTTRTYALKNSRVSSDDVELLVVGGNVRNGRNGDYFNGTALVDDDPESDGGRPKLGEVIVNDDALLPDIYDGFQEVGNVVKGEFSVAEGDLDGHVRLFGVDETELEVVEPDDGTRQELIGEIRNYVPQATIADIADNLSGQTRNEDGDVYTVTSDIRRIEGDIYDGYKNPDKGNGAYTIRDETVFDEEDIVQSPVHDEENASENATPGLTCWTDPNLMDYGTESICEFFGTLSQNDDGEIQMNVHGIVPVLEEEYDGYTDNSSNEEQEQVETSNVDRTEI